MPDIVALIPDAVPIYADNTARDTAFPTPSTNQRVQNLAAGRYERYSGSAWLADFVTAGYNVADAGATGDGTTDDTTHLTTAQTNALAAGLLALTLPAGTYKITSNTTFTIPLHFQPGAKLAPTTSVVVTLASGVQAFAKQQIFTTGAGTISYNHGDHVYPEWWGALVDGSHDDSTAINAALTAVVSGARVVRLTDGTWSIAAPIVMPDDTHIQGTWSGTIIKPTSALSTGAALVPGNRCTIDGLFLNGINTTGCHGVGIGIVGSTIVANVVCRNLRIQSFVGSSTSAGLQIQQAVLFLGTNLFLEFNQYNVVMAGTVVASPAPTTVVLEHCWMYEAATDGMLIQNGQNIYLLNCVFESNYGHGFHVYNTATPGPAIDNVVLETCYFENNWLSLAGNPTARNLQFDANVAGVTSQFNPVVTFRNCYFPTAGTAAQSIHLTSALDFCVDHCSFVNLSCITIDGNSNGTFVNWRRGAGLTNFYQGSWITNTSTGDVICETPQSGTFTPAFVDQSNNPTSGGTYAGTWTREGKRVTVTVAASAIATAGMTSGQRFILSNLPFAAANTAIGAVIIGGIAFTKSPPVVGTVSGGTTALFWENATGATGQYLTVGEITSGSGILQFTITYQTAN